MLNIRGSLVLYQILFLKVWGMQMCDIVWYPSHLCNWYSTSQLSTRGSGPNILVFDISKLQQSREAAGQRLFLAVLPRRRRPMLQPFSKTYTPWISFLRKRRSFFKLEACWYGIQLDIPAILAIDFLHLNLCLEAVAQTKFDVSTATLATNITLSKYRKSIRAWEFGYGNAIFEIFKKKTYGKEVLLDGVKRLIRLAQARGWAKAAPPLCLC